MTAVTKEITIEREVIEDDISPNEEITMSVEEDVDNEKMAKLKAKMAAKQKETEEDMPARIVEKKTRSIRFGVVGSGQAGSRLAETFYKLGYDAIAINTAQQDLEHIKIPDTSKLLLDYSLGGASKELSIGHDAAEMYKDSINELIHNKLGDAHVFIFATSLGGGSGAGSTDIILNILSGLDRPVLVMAVLPMTNEDSQTKNNSLQTLAKLANATKAGQIAGLIVIDNAKIEAIYTDVSQLNFYEVANNAIVNVIDVFNTLSSQPSPSKSLDPMELSKILTDGRGLVTYGQMTVPNYTDDTAIAEAVIDNLNSNLLSSGFDLKESRYVGVMIVASEAVWNKVPAGSINYALSMINDLCSNPVGVFRGIYTVDSDEDVVKVYSMFSGLSLPTDRVEQLKKDVKELVQKSKQKDEERNLHLKLDTGTEETVSAADAIKQKIQAKKSAFGKLMQRGIVDRRK